MNKQEIINRLQQAINQVESMNIEGDLQLLAGVDEGGYSDSLKILNDFTIDLYQDEDETDKIFMEVYLDQ